jgi:hypothetical protein
MATREISKGVPNLDVLDDDVYEEILLADGFEGALIGVGFRFHHAVAIYDKEACLLILETRDGMSREESLEFFDFNVAGAFVGEHTPIYIEQWVGATRRH